MSSDESLANIAIKGASELGLKFRCEIGIEGYHDGSWFDKVWLAKSGGIKIVVTKRYRSSQLPIELSFNNMPADAELEREVVEVVKMYKKGVKSPLGPVYKACYLLEDITGFIEIKGLNNEAEETECSIHDSDLRELEASVITEIYARFGGF